ncbi:MAG: monothiol glutaredoxin, Grx4 family [Deltaproteobacteria bacterium RBG_13_65_10]|nr:MAG: monothiol glutaredoxin, Grx4 family [Deltaproteobacteria bacterium RBG_13_65_10]
MSEDVLNLIKDTIAKNKVVLFMKGTPDFPQCGFSAATVQILREIGAPFTAVDVFSDPELRPTLKEFSSWPTFPQLYVNGRLVGGCDIVREIHARGELGPMIEEPLGR